MTTSETRRLIDVLFSFVDFCAKDDSDLGFTPLIQHRIPLKPEDSEPFFQKSRRFPMNLREQIIAQVEEQERAGLVRPSTSSWSSPMVPILKKDGTLRICINYQGLNIKTVQNVYPLPQIAEIFDALGRSKFYSKMDLTSGFYQVGMYPPDIHKTAFTVPGLGLYEWTVMPMGLTGSPATFQSLLDRVLAGLKYKCAFAYIDDIIVFSETYERHLEHLHVVFTRLRKAGLKIKLKKCRFACVRMEFLGHVISNHGISVDEAKIEKIVHCKVPECVKDIQSFLGLSGYYRQFVKGYSKIAAPMNRLLHADVSFEWGEDQQKAFESLKTALTTTPVLAYPDMNKPFILATDASRIGFGAVLSQLHGGKERPTAYASRSLTPAEKRYGITELEMAAACFSILRFRHYLYRQRFTLVTDHQPLKWVFQAKEQASNRMERLKLSVAVYIAKMDVVYKSGPTHTNADAMSRYFLQGAHKEGTHDFSVTPERRDDSEVDLTHDIRAVTRKAAKDRTEEIDETDASTLPVPDPTLDDDMIISFHPHPENVSTPKPKKNWEITPSEIKKEQDKAQSQLDLVLEGFNQEVITNICEEQAKDPEMAILIKFHKSEELTAEESNVVYTSYGFDQCFVNDRGILMWSSPHIKRTEGVIVLPPQCRTEAFKTFHDAPWTGAHQGYLRTFAKIAERYYWPRMRHDIKVRCERCRPCALRKNPRKYTRAEMKLIPLCTEPWQRIASDIIGPLPLTEKGNKYIITFTDYFTKWTEAHALPDQKAETIARCMIDQVLCRYGTPRMILTDQGKNYMSGLFKVVCEILSIGTVRTTAYHPETDGISERFGRTLQAALAQYVNDRGTDWDMWLQPMMLAIRLSVHRTIGDSPYYCLFGRQCRVPMDHDLNMPSRLYYDHDDYKVELVFALRDAWAAASTTMKAAQARSKFDYDKNKHRWTNKDWMVGQLVDMWHPKDPQVPKKFWKPWRGPYRIIRVEMPNVWVYRIDDPKQRVLNPVHVNRLKHFSGDHLPPLFDRSKTDSPKQTKESPEPRGQSEPRRRNETPEPEVALDLSKTISDRNTLPAPRTRRKAEFSHTNDENDTLTQTQSWDANTSEISQDFPPGSLVWAKMKGYVKWPAEVLCKLRCPLKLLHHLDNPRNRCVRFFGENTYQVLHLSKLTDYGTATMENRSKCNTALFCHALSLIEEAYKRKLAEDSTASLESSPSRKNETTSSF
ncbi:MAG: DDE-type integrase/transposase/recombinase [Gammaproteobacteria bacterium]|nr:DDE-type integrase/transposase/recombinase [Gammaproteobacteria bacterium]